MRKTYDSESSDIWFLPISTIYIIRVTPFETKDKTTTPWLGFPLLDYLSS